MRWRSPGEADAGCAEALLSPWGHPGGSLARGTRVAGRAGIRQHRGLCARVAVAILSTGCCPTPIPAFSAGNN